MDSYLHARPLVLDRLGQIVQLDGAELLLAIIAATNIQLPFDVSCDVCVGGKMHARCGPHIHMIDVTHLT